MKKLNNPTTTLFAGLFLTILTFHSACLNDGIVIKIKKPFTLSFLFKKPFFIFVTMMTVYKTSVYTPSKKLCSAFYM